MLTRIARFAAASRASVGRVAARRSAAGACVRVGRAFSTAKVAGSEPAAIAEQSAFELRPEEIAKALHAAKDTPPQTASKEHVELLRQQAKQHMSLADFVEARRLLLEALQHQEALFKADVSLPTFIDTVRVLSDIVTCIRMSGVDPTDSSSVDMVVGFYESARSQLLTALDGAADSAAKVEGARSRGQLALEHPAIYTFVCFTAGCYIDGEAFTKAKELLSRHLLFDVDSTAPSSTSGSYDLTDLRIASALNFTGIALFSDHSACSGHGHGGHGHHHHHHTHDHKEAAAMWQRALTYTAPFTAMLHASKPVGQLDATDQLMLQATSIILDNLAQVSMTTGAMEEAVAFSRQDVANLACAYSAFDSRLVAGQAQCLKTLLETHNMDDAEVLCEQMLAAFPHPKPGVDESSESVKGVPSEVTLDTSRIYDDLSSVMFQFQNLDYAEKFLQMSLLILRARLVDEAGAPLPVHPAIARAENGLGLLQIQMKDYANAEAHLQRGLDMKLALAAQGHRQAAADGTGVLGDDGLAEFHHNLGLAFLGQNKTDAAEKALLAARDCYVKRFTSPDGTVNLVHASYAGLCSQLASLYRTRSEDRKALAASKEALALKQQLFAAHSPQLVGDLYMTANLLANSLSEYAESIPLYKQLVSILEKPQGGRPPNASSLGATLHWLAMAYDKTTPREPAMAADAWRKAIVQLEKAPVMGVRGVLPLRRELKRVVTEMGLTQEAAELDVKIAENEAQLEKEQAAQVAAQAAAAQAAAAKEAQKSAKEGEFVTA